MNRVSESLLTSDQVGLLGMLPDPRANEFPQDRSEIPASVYVDPVRHTREWNEIFQSCPVPIAPSALLPRPGMVARRDLYGKPIIVTRAKDGIARAFLNVCRHRGTLLCEEQGPTKTPRLVCPYHAWAYTLDGTLAGVPRQDSFSDFERSAHNLIALPCSEAGGLIWVGLDQNRSYDFSSVEDGLAKDLLGIGLDKMHLFTSKTYEVGANWKLIIDAFLEGYHVTRLHAKSAGKFFTETPMLFNPEGPHIRMATARGNFDQDVGATYGSVRDKTVIAYHLFPNGILITSPTYVSLMFVIPKAPDSAAVELIMLTDGPPETPERELHYQRSFDLIDQVFDGEDFRAAALAQQGVETGAVATLLLGGLEQTIRLFHDNLEAQLALAGEGERTTN